MRQIPARRTSFGLHPAKVWASPRAIKYSIGFAPTFVQETLPALSKPEASRTACRNTLNLLDRLDPNYFAFTLSSKSGYSLNGFTSLYFSFITLGTVGYGDIAPMSAMARMLAMVEAMFGMFYMAMLIARLVSLYSSKTPLEVVNREGIGDTKGVESENSQTRDQE
ncbi:MAG: two pore domain potassium channel family protein [Verrucomicrobia bacterium]|nr:two pore domain potassium channel family protein [Verrucomicrobiota bacterium]MBV8485191.1 two pore domain potassium channel family protein [Verrucomicrobiota bacterium]